MAMMLSKAYGYFSEGFAESAATPPRSETMRTMATIGTAIMVLTMGASSAVGQINFDSGSDGLFGPINIASGTVTLDLPPDGIFNATTINVAAGATLRFNRNALNTPVYLLATGDIIIEGTIDVGGAGASNSPPVGGKGGPGGYDGGSPGFLGVPAGAGFGPGAGLGGPGGTAATAAGRGVYGGIPSSTQRPNDGSRYGTALLVPLVGGSGGGGTTGTPGNGGGGGGGAILLASNTRVQINSPGRIDSNGGASGDVSGSGGAIRIVAPDVAGNGRLAVNGGLVNTRAGHGRIRVDALDRTALQFVFAPTTAIAVGKLMFVFPDGLPRLDILEAAGQVIPENQAGPVLVMLPFGSTTSRTVTVQGRGFAGIVPIQVVLTPENGVPVVYPADIDMSLTDPAQVVVAVEIPVNTLTRIDAWRR